VDSVDTEESLQHRINLLQSPMDEVQNVGASQHATLCLANRAKQVAEQKLSRLKLLRERREAYAKASDQREAFIMKVLNGVDPKEIAQEVHGYRAYTQNCVHDGDLLETEKGDFDNFLMTFGLPDDHEYVIEAQRVLDDSDKAWCKSASRLMEEKARVLMEDEFGKEADAYKLAANVENVFVLAKLVGSISTRNNLYKVVPDLSKRLKEHAVRLRAQWLEGLATDLLEEVLEIAEKDNDFALTAKDDAGGKAAAQAAERMKNLMSMTLGKGVPAFHNAIITTRQKMIELKAEAVRRDAVAFLYEDAQIMKTHGWIANKAIELSDKIEEAVKKAQSEGVARTHPKLSEALDKAQNLREQEGFRKREATAAKKRAEKEAAERAAAEEAARQKAIEEEQARRAKLKAALGSSVPD